MKEIFNTLLIQIGPYIVSIIGIMTTIIVARLASYVKTKTTNSKVEFAIDRVSHTVDTVVASLTQTVISSMKEASIDGKLTKEDAEKVKADATKNILKIINSDVVDVAKTYFGDFDVFLSNKIEQAVNKSKQ